MVNSELMEQWLSDFRRHMSLLPTEEREEIVREIAAHMRDAAEQPGIRPEEILARLGDAKQLAAEYRDGSLIRQASRSYSPLLLLRGSLRMATKGITGITVFFLGLFGYLLGISMLAVAFFKCIVPQTTGVWVENGRILEAGTMLQQTRPNAHEVLGFWMIPAALTLASLFLLATTAGIRTTLRLSRRVQTHIQI